MIKYISCFAALSLSIKLCIFINKSQRYIFIFLTNKHYTSFFRFTLIFFNLSSFLIICRIISTKNIKITDFYN